MSESSPNSTSDIKWAVWRTDDTGNTFLVRDGLTQDDAQQLIAEFEARGHKQTYFAESEKA